MARTQVKHYYIQRLMQREFWAKLLSGKVALGALKGLARNLRLLRAKTSSSNTQNQPFQQRMAGAWTGFGGSILLILSGNDYTAKEFIEYAALDAHWSLVFKHSRLERHAIVGADHTFSNLASQLMVEKITLQWLYTHFPLWSFI